MIKQDVVVEKGEYLLEMEFNGLWTIRIYTFMQKDCPYLNIYNRWERERERERKEREGERELTLYPNIICFSASKAVYLDFFMRCFSLNKPLMLMHCNGIWCRIKRNSMMRIGHHWILRYGSISGTLWVSHFSRLIQSHRWGISEFYFTV